MSRHKVGTPYLPNQQTWPETTRLTYPSGRPELAAFLRRPDPDEIRAFESGPVAIAIVRECGVIFLCAQFGDLKWLDAPLVWWRLPKAHQAVPVRPGPDRTVFDVVLVDASDGIVRAAREVLLCDDVSKVLYEWILEQIRRGPFDAERSIGEVYAKYVNSEELARVAQARCWGG